MKMDMCAMYGCGVPYVYELWHWHYGAVSIILGSFSLFCLLNGQKMNRKTQKLPAKMLKFRIKSTKSCMEMALYCWRFFRLLHFGLLMSIYGIAARQEWRGWINKLKLQSIQSIYVSIEWYIALLLLWASEELENNRKTEIRTYIRIIYCWIINMVQITGSNRIISLNIETIISMVYDMDESHWLIQAAF